jgi:hypothetical protein
MFDIDFNRLFLWLLPSFWRKPKLLALLRCYCYPLIKIHGEFMQYRAANIYTLTHNSQVCSMENVFNDRFDNDLRRIYITDGFTKERKYVYPRQDDKPLYLGTIPLYNNGDYADTGVDAIVWVPTQVFLSPQDLIELTALVNKYRLASKRFKIYRV